MTMIYHSGTPSPVLLRDIMSKVNALGSEPRVIVEVDKMAYVPGLKSKWEVSEWVKNTSIHFISANRSTKMEEPESGQARYEYIVCAANHACKKWGLDEYAVAFLMAIAKHETGLGTLGMGVKSKGSNVLGYGCYRDGYCDPAYHGINKQMYYGAKRYAEAMKSRIQAIRNRGGFTRDDVDWFHEGGDKGYGKWVWSADGDNWKNRVYQYVQEFLKEDLTCKLDSFSFDLDGGGGSNNTDVNVVPTFPIKGKYFGNGPGDAVVTSHSSKNPNATRTNHKGIDIALRASNNGYGAEVVAAWDGIVVKSYTSSSYGECVIIRHANGWETLYAHLVRGSRRVSEGQRVKQGQTIGQMGNTGNVIPAPTPQNPFAGTHLHFEIWKGGWVYGGDGWIDPYPVLTGQQRISAGSGSSEDSDKPQMEITENVKFDKCFNKDGALNENWVHTKNVSWFSVSAIGRKVIGYKPGAVKAGDHDSFAFRHNFSADGYFEYSLYLDLKQGDRLTVAVDGIPVEVFNHEDSSNKVIYSDPVYVNYDPNFPARVIDFHLESSSGKATVGIVCFKAAEIEVLHGTTRVGEDFTVRTEDRWYEIGDFVYEDTFYIEDDVVEWEVNTHYDMQSATARVTLDNSKGIYSPNYQKTADFPDNKIDSPFTYYENGKLQHVLSEGAPVRIYAGYGDNLVRVFTGKIKGEVEEDAERKTITFNCVDMYDVLEEHVFHKVMAFPDPEEFTDHHDEEDIKWVVSEIVKVLVREAGLVGWRYHEEDLKYPDYIIEDTYYIDIDRGTQRAVMLDENGNPELVEIKPEKWFEGGYKNPYVIQAQWQIGTRASDAIGELISDINYRAYCNRYGTFVLEPIEYGNNTIKWEFVDGENLIGLSSSVDYSRVRNHLMITGSAGLVGKVEHFFDKDLLIATKGNIRTMGIQLDWIDESFGANARGQKEAVAKKAFFDMKRMARTYNVVVKGNPLIEVMDGCYIYDRATSTQGYYIIKGNRLVGNREGMLNFLELTWENVEGGDSIIA